MTKCVRASKDGRSVSEIMIVRPHDDRSIVETWKHGRPTMTENYIENFSCSKLLGVWLKITR